MAHDTWFKALVLALALLNIATFLYFVPTRLAPPPPPPSRPSFGGIVLLRETLTLHNVPRVVTESTPARVLLDADGLQSMGWLTLPNDPPHPPDDKAALASVTPHAPATLPVSAKQPTSKPGESATEEKSKPPAAPTATPPAAGACFIAGPVTRDGKLSRLLQQHRAFFGELTLVSQTQRVLSSYLVYLPPADDFEHAQAQLAALQARGQDAWIFRDGALRGAISLGVFHDAARAEKARQSFNAQGLAAQVMPRYREEAQWFVAMRQPVGAGYAERLAQALRRLAPALQFSSCKQTLHAQQEKLRTE